MSETAYSTVAGKLVRVNAEYAHIYGYASPEEIIREINRQGTAILLVEQNAFMALQVAHRAYVLETGKVVLSGVATELLRDPKVKAAYLGE